MTIRVRPDIDEELDRIAADTRRSKSFFPSEALAAYVERELAILEGIQRGLENMKTDRVVRMNRSRQNSARPLPTQGIGAARDWSSWLSR